MTNILYYYFNISVYLIISQNVQASPVVNGNGCSNSCPERSEVCGIDEGGVKQTFPSVCALQAENCAKKTSKFNISLCKRDFKHFYYFAAFQKTSDGPCP